MQKYRLYGTALAQVPFLRAMGFAKTAKVMLPTLLLDHVISYSLRDCILMRKDLFPDAAVPRLR